jgi:hypothetical protein
MSRPNPIPSAIVMRLLTMLIVWLILLIWVFNAHRAGCVPSAMALVTLGGVIFLAGSERSHLLRRAMLNEAARREGRLFRVFYNGLLITLRDVLVAALLAVILLASALTFAPQQWSVLFADLLLLSLLIPRLADAMGREVRDFHRFALARQWAVWISVLLLWAEGMMSLVFYPPADFTGMRWQEVVTFNLRTPDVACGLLETATQVFITGQAIAIWALQNSARVANDPTQSIMLWVGYTALIGFTFATALAYSRALIGVLGRPWEMWQPVTTGHDLAIEEPKKPIAKADA